MYCQHTRWKRLAVHTWNSVTRLFADGKVVCRRSFFVLSQMYRGPQRRGRFPVTGGDEKNAAGHANGFSNPVNTFIIIKEESVWIFYGTA